MRNGHARAALLALSLASQVCTAADLCACPKVTDIKALKLNPANPLLAAPYNRGYEYKAPGESGKDWHGETLGSNDSYLEARYELRPEKIENEREKIVCTYVGKAISGTGDPLSQTYLKLIQEK